MASFNQSERQPISPKDNEQAKRESALKLIADFGVAGKFRKRNGFWRKLCCCTGTTASDEAINISVPVKDLNKHLHIAINCRSTKINVKMHPENEDGVEVLRNVDVQRLKEILSTVRSEGRYSCSTKFSSPFPEFGSSSVYCDAEAVDCNTYQRRNKTI